MKRSLLVGLVALCSAVTVSAQEATAPRTVPAPRGAPPSSSRVPRSADQGFSPERLARIDTFLQRYVDDRRIAGAVALVLQDGRTIYERAVGWSDREAGRRMTTETIFRIASQTKAIASVAALILMEEGTLGLADPVSRYIPAFDKTRVLNRVGTVTEVVPAKRPITIRDLLTHTAGISYGVSPEVAALYEEKALGPAAGFGWYIADKDEQICDTMERLASLPFVGQPGEAWVYGYNTDVLGCVVERASGMPLDAFIRSRITGPLGMRDTHFFLPPGERSRLASVYATGQDGRAVRAPEGARGQGHYVDGPRRNFSGGAGLVSTARDYARFLEMIRNGGQLDGVRILSPRSVRLMTTNQVGTLRPNPDLGFGLGFETTDRFGANGLDPRGAFGWGGAYGTIYRVDPTSGTTMVLMLQLLPNGTDIRAKFLTMVYQALLDPPAPLAPTRD
jgi:CubicO group peptidase (beta-lactamase class C family)